MQNCYNPGRMPGEIKDEQDERLTTKHIHTLQFLQEIVKENKELKAQAQEYEEQFSKCKELHALAESSQERIKQIQEQYLSRADEINTMLTEKHQVEMMKKVEEHVEAEKQWAAEKGMLVAEIERLKKEIARLEAELEGSKEHRGQTEILNLKIAAMQQEIDRIKEENTKIGEANKNQLTEIKRLQFVDGKSHNLDSELKEANQKNKELQFRISKLEKELSESKEAEQDEVLNTLRKQLHKVHKEKAAWEAKDKDYVNRVGSLDSDNAGLRKALQDSEKMRMDLRTQMDALLQELSMLRHQINVVDRDKQTFGDFVQLKREMAIVKAENEEMKSRLKARYSGGTLPSLKEPQITAVRKGSVSKMGAGGGKRDIQISPSPYAMTSYR